MSDIQANEMLSAINQESAEVKIPSPGEENIAAFEEALTQMAEMINDMYNSMVSMQMGLKALNTRIENSEKFLSFLLSKDPDMMKKIEEMVATNEKQANT